LITENADNGYGKELRKYGRAAREMGVLGRPTDRGRSLEVKVVIDIPCSHRTQADRFMSTKSTLESIGRRQN
jgi:hypothetical protein